MATATGYPFVSSYEDRHGKTRWRFRRAGKTTSLPGEPGEPAFEAAYRAVVEGRAPAPAEVRRLPSAAAPRTMRAAWRIVTTRTAEWRALSAGTRVTQTQIAERFLALPVQPGQPKTYGDVEIAHIERRHVRAILAQFADTPHAAGHYLRLIRKLIGVALDEEWITVDPTYRLKYRPPLEGWRAWTEAERAAYEQRWPIGTTPRLAYALALYTGQRRSDIATLRWEQIEAGGVTLTQRKTRKRLWIPIHPSLAEVLAATERKGEVVLLSAYGKPYSDKALGMRMQEWTRAAGLPAGVTLHGLRKTLGKLLAEAGATTRQIMDILGHDDIAHAELYSREAEQKTMAREGMKRIAGGPKLTVIEGDG